MTSQTTVSLHATPAARPGDTAASSPGQGIGLLLLRLAVGLTLAAHGSQKLFGWFGGSGLDASAEGFTALGYPAGTLMAWVAGLTEFCGGLGLAAGLLTPLAAAACTGTMINAVGALWDYGFFNSNGGYEYPFIMGVAVAAIALTGPGRYAADRLLPVPALNPHRFSIGVAAVALGVVTAVVFLLIRG